MTPGESMNGHNEQGGLHEATATKHHRHHLRKLQIPSNETLQKFSFEQNTMMSVQGGESLLII